MSSSWANTRSCLSLLPHFFSLIPQNLAWWLAHRRDSINGVFVVVFAQFGQMEGSDSNFKHEHLWVKLLNAGNVPPKRCIFAVPCLRLWLSTVSLSSRTISRSNCFLINKSRLRWFNMWNLHIMYFLWVSGNDIRGNRREILGCVVPENLLDHKSYQAGNSPSSSLSFKD